MLCCFEQVAMALHCIASNAQARDIFKQPHLYPQTLRLDTALLFCSGEASRRAHSNPVMTWKRENVSEWSAGGGESGPEEKRGVEWHGAEQVGR